jgi:hypothetical protein
MRISRAFRTLSLLTVLVFCFTTVAQSAPALVMPQSLQINLNPAPMAQRGDRGKGSPAELLKIFQTIAHATLAEGLTFKQIAAYRPQFGETTLRKELEILENAGLVRVQTEAKEHVYFVTERFTNGDQAQIIALPELNKYETAFESLTEESAEVIAALNFKECAQR